MKRRAVGAAQRSPFTLQTVLEKRRDNEIHYACPSVDCMRETPGNNNHASKIDRAALRGSRPARASRWCAAIMAYVPFAFRPSDGYMLSYLGPSTECCAVLRWPWGVLTSALVSAAMGSVPAICAMMPVDTASATTDGVCGVWMVRLVEAVGFFFGATCAVVLRFFVTFCSRQSLASLLAASRSLHRRASRTDPQSTPPRELSVHVHQHLHCEV